MGHESKLLAFNESTNNEKIVSQCQSLERISGCLNTTCIRSYDDEILSETKDVEGFLSLHANGWYDNLAVRYRETQQSSKRLEALIKRHKEAEKQCAILQTQSVQSMNKAKLIICKSCGSKLASAHLHGWMCPLCHADLRSETHCKKVVQAKQRLEYIEILLEQELQRLTKKART